MTTYITLAARSRDNCIAMTRDAEGNITVFVFSNSDNAVDFANKHLAHNNDKWGTDTHDKHSLDNWLDSAEKQGATHATVDPDSENPRVIPIAAFRTLLGLSP